MGPINLIINFFFALSECFCEQFPETLLTYKRLLSCSPDEMVAVESSVKVFVTQSKDALVNKDSSQLPVLVLFDESIDLNQIFMCARDNAEVIWSHLHLIMATYFPNEEMPVVEPQESAVNFIEKMIVQVASQMPPIDPTANPQQVFTELLKTDIISNIFTQVQSQMAKQADFTPSNLLLAVSKVLAGTKNFDNLPIGGQK